MHAVGTVSRVLVDRSATWGDDMFGPTPRGWRRCRWLCDDGSRCDGLVSAGPGESVVCLCDWHTSDAMPRGTMAQQRERYFALIAAYGWKRP